MARFVRPLLRRANDVLKARVPHQLGPKLIFSLTILIVAISLYQLS